MTNAWDAIRTKIASLPYTRKELMKLILGQRTLFCGLQVQHLFREGCIVDSTEMHDLYANSQPQTHPPPHPNLRAARAIQG